MMTKVNLSFIPIVYIQTRSEENWQVINPIVLKSPIMTKIH